MMRHLILRHEMLRCLPKLMALVFALTGVVHGVVVYFSRTTADGEWLGSASLRILQVCVYLSATLVLTMPSAGRRARAWELNLPIPGRQLWRTHRHVLLLCGILVMLTYAPLPLVVWNIQESFSLFPWLDTSATGWPRLCWDLWGLPLVFWIMTVDLATGWWSDQAYPGGVPEWRSNLFSLVAFMAVALLIISSFGLTLLVIWLPLPVAWWNRRRAVPEGLLLPDTGPGERMTGDAEGVDFQPASRGWAAHRLLVRVVFKWPAHWLVMPSLAVLYGVFLSGTSPFGEGSALLRFGHVFMASYMMVAGAGFLLEKLHLVDHLPIPRRLILGWLVWPLIGGVVLGYGLGTWTIGLQDDPVERIRFVNSPEGYGLKVPPRTFQVIKAKQAPAIEAPWGESHAPETYPVLKGLPWIIYKPYTTPEGASLRFVRWQLGRAIEATYGEKWQESGLFQQQEGRVVARPGGLRLAADHPRWRPVSVGPVFPVLLSVLLLAFFPGLGLLFAMLRRQASLLKTRVLFGSLMALYMALHLGGLAIFMAGWSDDWIVEGVVLGALSRPETTGIAFTLAAYGFLALVLNGGQRLVQGRFEQLEATR